MLPPVSVTPYPPAPPAAPLPQWMVGGKHVDFDGHDLLTRPLSVGETFTVTMSGRSSQVAVADVLLFVCDPTQGPCGGGSPYWQRAVGMAASACA